MAWEIRNFEPVYVDDPQDNPDYDPRTDSMDCMMCPCSFAECDKREICYWDEEWKTEAWRASVGMKKYFELLTDEVVSVLADGKFPTGDKERWESYLKATNGGDRVLAVLEFPYIDIELEAWTSDYFYEPAYAKDEDTDIALSYMVCIRGLYHGKDTWETDEGAGECKVDFSAENWEELLENEMVKRLAEYVEEHGYSFTEPNFNYA
jgi:hypothetical protein